MGGDEGEGAAPGGDRFGDAIEQGLVFVEGKFIEFDVTAFAGEGVWVGGDGIDAAARGEFEDVSREGVIAGVNDLTEVLGGEVEDASPGLAVLEGEAGLE